MPTTLIGKASSRSDRDRWTEIQIERREDASYIVVEIGRSVVAGEHDRARTRYAERVTDLRDALTRNGRLTAVAEAALREAASRDGAIATALPGLLHPDVPPEMLERAEQYDYLTRDGQRLRGLGWTIGSASSEQAASPDWSEVVLIRTTTGMLVGVSLHRLRGGTSDWHEAVEAPSLSRLVKRLTRPGVGFVDGTLLDAIDAARVTDERVAQEVGSGDAAAWAHPIVGSTAVLVGDARHGVLTRLAAGGSLETVNDAAGRVVLARVTGADRYVSPIDPMLFLALSRQRLIQRRDVAEPIAAGVAIEWTISIKGSATLAEAMER